MANEWRRHRDLVLREVDTLHAEAQTLHETHAGAVEESEHNPGNAIDVAEDRAHLVAGQHHRESAAALGTNHVFEVADGLTEAWITPVPA